MPKLLALVEQVKGEFFGETSLFGQDTSTRFHTFQTVMPMVMDVAREVAVQLMFPRYTLEFTKPVLSKSYTFDPDDDDFLISGAPKFISRVLSASFNGFTVAEGSLAQTLDYSSQASGWSFGAFPRSWSWNARTNTFMWGPALQAAGTWTIEVVADDYPRLDPLVDGVPPKLSLQDFFFDNPSFNDWNDLDLWDGLYSEWSQVVKFGALMRLFLKERNTEQTEIYAALFQDSLAKFAEFLRVPVPGAMMKEGAS